MLLVNIRDLFITHLRKSAEPRQPQHGPHVQIIREHMNQALNVVMTVGENGLVENIVTDRITSSFYVRLINLFASTHQLI
jgi:hypothetical protein